MFSKRRCQIGLGSQSMRRRGKHLQLQFLYLESCCFPIVREMPSGHPFPDPWSTSRLLWPFLQVIFLDLEAKRDVSFLGTPIAFHFS